MHRMNHKDIPGRVFLDTCVVNFILDHSEEIHEGVAPPAHTGDRVLRDIEALYNIFLVGQRAMWQFAISPHTYQEIAATQNPHRQYHLESWFGELWQYWRGIIHENDDLPTFIEAEDARVGLLTSSTIDALPDLSDRVLLCDAVVYRCEIFCTRDWRTILKHRSKIKGLPLEILTPAEWWAKIQPYASLWV